MAYKDIELTEEELMEVTAGIKNGKTEEMFNKLSKEELEQFKDNITQERELNLEELDNIKAGIPQEMVDEFKESNNNLFRKQILKGRSFYLFLIK